MIEKVRRIRSFGSYVSFDWPADLCELKRFNVLYGWNYSGKTMLSRIFRCLENRALHPDFPTAEAQFDCIGNASCSLAAPDAQLEIRVFNTDFVRDNLRFDAGSADPILMLGAPDITKETKLDERKLRREELTQTKLEASQKLSEIQASLDKAMTAKARDEIKNPLGVPNYDKNKLLLQINACKGSPSSYQLDGESVKNFTAQYLSIDKRDQINNLNWSYKSLDILRGQVAEVLSRRVTGQRIPRLADNPVAEQWVDRGRSLHVESGDCLFCGRPLPLGLLDTLRQHFSNEYDQLMSSLSKLRDDIAQAEEERTELPHAIEFYPEQSTLYASIKDEIEGLEDKRRSTLLKLAELIEQKRSKAFTAMECPEIEDPKQELVALLVEVQNLINLHNERTRSFGLNRQAAFAKLQLHVAASFVVEHDYSACIEECERLQSQIDQADQELIGLNEEILRLEKQVSEATRGAERINELLSAYFGKDDLAIRVSDDRFQIVRDGEIARNLSEGEETAIAFAYFITCLHDGKTPITNMIVVIDDPISSLDANHLFNTYALIKTQIANCKQLLLLTHSPELFNLAKDWAAEDEKRKMSEFDKWTHWRFFLVRRGDDGGSRIEKIPKELMEFKSEYHYLFSELHRFSNDQTGGFDRLFTLPNVTRRFLEAFGGIMIPKSQGLRGKMDRLFADPIDRERVWKFINHYSHQTTVMRSLTIPDASECRAVVASCLNAVRARDNQYFEDLVAEVS